MSDSLLSGSPLDWALRYIKLGWAVFPVDLRIDNADGQRIVRKTPMIRQWQIDATLNEKQVRDWWGRWPKAGIGIRTGDRFWMLDVDIKNGGEADLDFLFEQFGRFPDTIQQVTGTGGYHFLFEMPDFPVRNLQGVQTPIFGKGIDVRGIGGYMVAAPSFNPQTQREYFWDGAQEIEEQKIAAAPKWMLDRLRNRHSAPAADPAKAAPPIAVKVLKGEGRHNVLVSLAGSFRRRGLSAAEMLPSLLATNQARMDPPYDEAHVRQIALSMEKYAAGKPYLPGARRNEPPPPAPTETVEFALNTEDVEAAAQKAIDTDDLKAAVSLAPEVAKLPPMGALIVTVKLKDHFKKRWPAREFDKVVRASEAPEVQIPDGDSGEGPNLSRQPYTEAGNGERLVAMFGHEIRFCNDFNKWLIWDGRRWVPDTVGLMIQKTKIMAREIHALGERTGNTALQRHARISEGLGYAKRSLEYAATEKGIPVRAIELDQSPFLLNCLNGVLDLKDRDLTLMSHDRRLLLTKLCPVEYDAKASAPLFTEFIARAMGCVNRDAELSERTAHLLGFLQRALGYSLTGDVTEKVLFVLHGPNGNNGKTTLVNLFRELLGNDYTGQILVDTLMNMKSTDSTARADLADLRGARLITTSEVNKESHLDEGKIKYIVTGMSSPIKCKRLYENPYEFLPTHKIFMDCNHLPIVRGTDPAIWKRLKLIPFDVTIPDDEIDTELPEKLRKEFPGILAWAARGCAAWVRKGLGVPPAVTKANKEWREHDDPLQEFLDDYCEIDRTDDDTFVMVRDLYVAYRERWAKEHGERYPLGRRSFNDALMAKDLKQSRNRILGGTQTRCWEGIKLRSEIARRVATASWSGDE